jgi:hypothetical protein
MTVRTARASQADPVIQFSVFTPNRVGRLSEIIGLFSGNGVHVLGLMVLDTTDSAIIRLLVDDPDAARDLLIRQSLPFIESSVVAVEVTPSDLARLMACLLQAELNLNYLYSFIPHPEGKSLLAMSMEDNELAQEVLRQNQFRVLSQGDVSR